jgi:hypothetical protein
VQAVSKGRLGKRSRPQVGLLVSHELVIFIAAHAADCRHSERLVADGARLAARVSGANSCPVGDASHELLDLGGNQSCSGISRLAQPVDHLVVNGTGVNQLQVMHPDPRSGMRHLLKAR